MDLNLLRASRLARSFDRPWARRKGLAIFLGLASLPSMAGLVWAGRAWGRNPVHPGALLLVLLPLALLSGIWDGACVLPFHAYRPFQARPRDLFIAELAAGLSAPVPRILCAAGAAFTVGAAWARPALLPWLLPALPLALTGYVALERAVGVLAGLFGRTLKTMLLFGGLFAGMRLLLATLMAGNNLRNLPTGQHLARLPLGPGVLPSTWGGLLCAWGAILGLAYLLLRPELLGERSPRTAGSPGAPWVFRRPWAGVARLHLHQVWTSKRGRLLLFLPIFALTSLVDPLVFGFRPGSTWILAWAGFMLMPLGRMACNLFGLDRGGVRGYWLLPLEDRDLLAGKVAAMALYMGVILALLTLCLALATPLRPVEVLGGAFLCAALACCHLRTGLKRSLEEPFPVDAQQLNMVELDDPTLVTLGRILLPWLLITGAWGVVVRIGPWWAVGAMAAALAWALEALRRRLPRAARMLPERREALTARLEGLGAGAP